MAKSKILAGLHQACAIAEGKEPAARIHVSGHAYVPETELIALRAEAEKALGVINTFQTYGCPVCGGDCFCANPPVSCCPINDARAVCASLSQLLGRK